VKILVVVASTTGRTKRMAEAAAEGARSAGGQVLLRPPEEAQEADLLEADAVILASPVHMGGIASSMRAFFERMAPLWLQGKLVGKLGAALVTGAAGEHGGAELALVSLLANLAENGMLLVPMHNRLEGYRHAGCHWGPLAGTLAPGVAPGPSEEQLSAARSHGRWVAECTARWLQGQDA
jgi:NAD(P)H dehydrogenase (quinone)